MGVKHPPPEKGNRRAVTHGAYAKVAPERLDAKADELFEALAADAPVREADGGLPAADTVAVRLAAETLCRLEDVRAFISEVGVFDTAKHHKAKRRKKEPRGSRRRRSVDPMRAVEMEDRLVRRLMDQLDSLGMTPRSRAKLGLDQARQMDLAREWADKDRSTRRRGSIEGSAREE